MVLHAQAEWLGAKREGNLVAERAARHYKMTVIINTKPFPHPIIAVREKTVAYIQGRMMAHWVDMSGMKLRSFLQLVCGPTPVFKNQPREQQLQSSIELPPQEPAAITPK